METPVSKNDKSLNKREKLLIHYELKLITNTRRSHV